LPQIDLPGKAFLAPGVNEDRTQEKRRVNWWISERPLLEKSPSQEPGSSVRSGLREQ